MIFIDKNGDHKMKYSSLKVWDANGVELRAYFEKSEKLQITNDKFQTEDQEKQIPNPGSSDGKGEIPVITDLSDLTPEQRETLRKILEELQKSQDLHLNKNTSPDAKNNQEEREQIRKTQNEIRKIARKEEEMKNSKLQRLF